MAKLPDIIASAEPPQADFRAMVLNFRVNDRPLAEVQRMLGDLKGAVPRALSAAANRTAQQIKTRVLRIVTSQINVKRSDIDLNKQDQRAGRSGGVRATLGNPQRPGARVMVSGLRMPLIRFATSAPTPGWKRQRQRRPTLDQATYRLRKDGGGRVVPGSFRARMKTGHWGFWKRSGRKRLPIVELFGPSIPQVLLDDVSMHLLMQQEAPALYQKNMSSQIDRFLQRRKASGGGPVDLEGLAQMEMSSESEDLVEWTDAARHGGGR
jgi:hypothetical protein